MSQKIRFGVFGASRIGLNRHVPAAAESEKSEIVAIASRKAETAKAWAAKAEIEKAYASYEQLLSDSEIDAVINTLPNSMHAEWTIKALNAGKHVLCEKPLGMNAGEVDEMFDVAEANNLQLMEGFITRFHPQLDLIRSTIDSGQIGEVNLMTAELVYPIGDFSGDSRTVKELGGGSLYDAGCYCTNIIRWVMGDEPVEMAATEKIHPQCNVDTCFTATLKFPGDKLATFTTGMEQPFRVWCEITGTTGRIHVSNLFAASTVTITAMGKEPKKIEITPGNLFRQQLDHFTECIKGNKVPKLSRAESRGNAATLEALKRTAKQ